MRLLFVADGRSPIALNWIRYFVGTDHEVHLASTFPCEPELPLDSLTFVPVAFSETKSVRKADRNNRGMFSFISGASYVGFRTAMRQWFGPLTLSRAKHPLRRTIERIKPHLIHAMRIPYEGMLVAKTMDYLAKTVNDLEKPAFVLSIWGNDFSLHARATPLMAHHTRRTLLSADGLHTDCLKDQRAAYEWGYPLGRPAIVLPGAGGLDLDIFSTSGRSALSDDREKRVINPRGVRAYIRNDTFFQAAALVLERNPHVRFTCTGMAGDIKIEQTLKVLGISSDVNLLPVVPHTKMPELFRQAHVAVSPSTHDGTPNTLLEAMACGCFPIAGDLESLREWINPGVNGLLFDPADPHALADAIMIALNDADLRLRAENYNTRLIAERASFSTVMALAEKFYVSLVYGDVQENTEV